MAALDPRKAGEEGSLLELVPVEEVLFVTLRRQCMDSLGGIESHVALGWGAGDLVGSFADVARPVKELQRMNGNAGGPMLSKRAGAL